MYFKSGYFSYLEFILFFLLFIGYVRIQLQDCLQKNINTQSD